MGSREGGHVAGKSGYEGSYLALDDFLVPGEAEIASGLLLLKQGLLDQLANHFLLQHLVGEQSGRLDDWNVQLLQL